MRIPKKFKIKGKEWTVEYRWNLFDQGVKCDGLCEAKDRTVIIDRSIPREEKWPVFLHEYCHAVIFEAHIAGLDGDAGELLEEIICEAFATSLDDCFNMRWKRTSKK